jgi:hypothetical protein
MKIRMAKPLFFVKEHLLANVDPFKDHAAYDAGAGWLKMVDGVGKCIFLSKTIQKKYFIMVEE